MTKYLTDSFPGFKDLNKFFVGFDHFLNDAASMHEQLAKAIPNYPPYNIKKIDENKYAIELAVAGFHRTDIEIEFVEDKLIIRGNANNDIPENNYLWKGISSRAFTRTFSLNDSIEVCGAELFNGILQVILERIIPEHKKPKKISINEPATGTKQFLAEGKKNDNS
jgi:molecular chaperone IbpA